MKHAIFQVDAFTNAQFKGNPAAVIPLDAWLEDEVLQKIAAENNLSETAFYIIDDDNIKLRWFTPETEVDLCGHATLATAWVLVNEYDLQETEINFETRSGILTVRHFVDTTNINEQIFELELPIQSAHECDIKSPLLSAFGHPPLEILAADDYLLLFESEQIIKELKPDFALLSQLPLRGVIVTAPGDEVDFVSRWFGPNVGVNEDPVTGSAHTSLTPYWANKLDKTLLTAKQVSRRGGDIECQLRNDKVLLRGKAKLYMKGEIYID